MRRRILRLLLALLPAAASAQTKSRQHHRSSKRPELDLYYYDYLADIAPLAIRTFTNAREWQRRMFGWMPSERTTVLLQDFSDYGNVHAFAAPRGTLIFDVAPISRAFETSPAGERMYTSMNHELVHVVQSDISSEEDRRWRRFFLGKVPAQSRHPETLLYSYLTIPRFTAPRWYSEGGAVFLETFMAGGLGRAQGGYDEMVFRAMVRDDAHFYDPLGLVSRGTLVDFQTGANAYLYGTRFFTYLAYTYGPDKVIAWIKRDEGSARYYAEQFQQVYGLPLDQAWQEWIVFEHEFQRRNLAEVRKFPITPERKLRAERARLRLAHVLRRGHRHPVRRIPLSRHCRARRRAEHARRHRAPARRHQGRAALHGRVVRLRSAKRHRVLDQRQQRAARSHGRRRAHGQGAHAAREREHRRARLQSASTARSWGCATCTAAPFSCAFRIRTPITRRSTRFPWEHVPSDLDISPDGTLLSATMTDDRGNQYVRVWKLANLLAGDVKPLSEFAFGQAVPESFVFSRDGRYLYGSSYYTGVSNIYRYEVATGKVEAVSNAETGFFRPLPLADGRLVVLEYTGRWLRPGHHRSEANR